MKKLSRILAVLLMVCMILSMIPTAFATGDEYAGKTVILHSNDVHGAIAGYAYMAGLKADFEAKGAEVILADAGDYSQGTTYVSLSKGANAVEMMNAVGYDVATLGNHEFDYGMEKALANVEAAAFPYVSCNFYHEKDGVAGERVLESAQIFETSGGLRVAVVGITTP